MTDRNIHLESLGLVRNPFPYTPDASCYFLTQHLEVQMIELAHCVSSRKGFALLTAEVGMGKSTLVRRLVTDLSKKNVVCALVFNTFLQDQELLAAILNDFGLKSTNSLSADIAELNTFLLLNHSHGKTCFLIVDDAQNLSDSSLELVRLLCNLETDQEKLLQILLAGQPELEETLAKHNLRQLRSRLVKHSRLYGLTSTEVSDYVKYRFASAGSVDAIKLQPDACQLLWKETNGVPRQIHLVMDRCLYGMAGRNSSFIDKSLMHEAIDDSRVDLLGRSHFQAAKMQTAPRKKLNWKRNFAGASATLLFAIAVWFGLQNSTLPALSAQASPVQQTSSVATFVSPALAEVPRLVVTTEADACLPKTENAFGRSAMSLQLPNKTQELFGARLRKLSDVCLQDRDSKTWVTWIPNENELATENRHTAARFQIALAKFGSLQSAGIDGIWGSDSRKAMNQFQSSVGLPVTGELDPLSGLILERFYVHQQ